MAPDRRCAVSGSSRACPRHCPKPPLSRYSAVPGSLQGSDPQSWQCVRRCQTTSRTGHEVPQEPEEASGSLQAAISPDLSAVSGTSRRLAPLLNA
eukprot:2661508-Alexandrium_andersonii.AAC.1